MVRSGFPCDMEQDIKTGQTDMETFLLVLLLIQQPQAKQIKLSISLTNSHILLAQFGYTSNKRKLIRFIYDDGKDSLELTWMGEH